MLPCLDNLDGKEQDEAMGNEMNSRHVKASYKGGDGLCQTKFSVCKSMVQSEQNHPQMHRHREAALMR